MAKHNWQTTERMCIHCGAVMRRDVHPCRNCGGNLEWNAFDLLTKTVGLILRTLGFLLIVPVLLYLIGSLSPLQIVVEHDGAHMRASGACYVPMPAVKTLIQIRAQCPAVHVGMKYPAQFRAAVLAFDASRREPWAIGISAVYDGLFSYVDAVIEWTATALKNAMLIPQRSPVLAATTLV